jgi:2-polyprenyl-3-methyl-5-hydroxy-6-metoxy-1,4-benzoquinol methylase
MRSGNPTGSVLALFPCDPVLADGLGRYIWENLTPSRVDCVVLSKQEAVRGLIQRYPFKQVIILEEPFYGRISKSETKEKLKALAAEAYTLAVFPHNDFRGNAFLLGACLAQTVRSVNAAHEGNERVIFDCPGRISKVRTSFPKYVSIGWDGDSVSRVLGRLAEKKVELENLSLSDGGERPTSGLLQEFPGNFDGFVRYQWAMSRCRGGDVAELGSGVGYGAFMLANRARSVIGLDTDEASVRFNEEAWSSLCPHLRFKVTSPTSLDLENECVDRAICFEVLEHVTEPKVMLGDLWRVLKPGGLLIASTPDPYVFPFKVNAEGVVSESPESYRKRGIWPWHISGLKTQDSLRIAVETGFSSAHILYTTYVAGFNYLSRILEADNLDDALRTLDESTHWKIDDFAITAEFSPYFSGYSYLLVAQKN